LWYGGVEMMDFEDSLKKQNEEMIRLDIVFEERIEKLAHVMKLQKDVDVLARKKGYDSGAISSDLERGEKKGKEEKIRSYK
jgi:hypothetical protein